MKKLIFLYIGIIVLLFGSALFTQAVDLQLPAFATASSSIAGMINQIYVYALSIAGVLAIVMIVYGGISYALDPGNASKQGEAKDIMQSAIWGIVLLAGAYVILKTINPDLVQLRDLQLEKIDRLTTLTITEAEENPTIVGTSPGGTSIGCTTENIINIQQTTQLAKDFLALNPRLQTGSCDSKSGLGTGSSQIINAVANGKVPAVCNWKGEDKDCSACVLGGPGGKTTVCPAVLNGLVAVQTGVKNNTVPGFTLTSITGGLHNENSGHYQGRKIDVVPFSKDITQWKMIGNEFAKNGGSVSCEADGVYKPLASCPENIGSLNDAHLDITFGGAGTPASDVNDQYGNTLRDELATLAGAYLSMHPNLLSNGSYGIPAGKTENTCSKFPLSSPWNVMNRVLNKQFPYVCDQSKVMLDAQIPDAYCSCSEGGTGGKNTLNKNVFRYLGDLQSMVGSTTNLPTFQVVTLTGGIQKEGASSYYSGVGVAITPTTYNKANLQKLFNAAKNLGYADATYQAFKVGVTLPSRYNNYTSASVFTTISSKNVDDVSNCKTEFDPNKILNDYKNASATMCYFGRIYVTTFDK